MKIRTAIISTLLFIGILLASVPARAQTAPPNPQTFFESFKGYFGGFNTNLPFAGSDTFDIWTGAEYVNNQNTSASLGISWNAFTLSSASGLTLGIETVTRNAGIAGVILSQSGGLNIQKTYLDTKFVGYFDGGYDFSLNKPIIEIGARVLKMLTPNTFAGIGIGERLGQKSVSNFPTLSVFAGFKL